MRGMHTTFRPLFIGLLATLLLPSCSYFKKKEQVVIERPNVRLSGRVQSVNEEARFVLIRRYGPWKVGEGELVESRGDGRSANLVPTGEKLGEHIAADIRGGNVEVGDAVYIRQISKSTQDQALLSTETSPDSLEVKNLEVKKPTVAPLPVQPTPPKIVPLPQPDVPEEPEDQL